MPHQSKHPDLPLSDALSLTPPRTIPWSPESRVSLWSFDGFV
jgi:hypothetical protein